MLFAIIRIIFTCIMGIFGVILMYTSFFISQEDQKIQGVEAMTLHRIPEFSSTGGVNSYENIGLFERIFSDTKNISYKKTSSGFIFDITQSGKYFSSLRDIGKEYIFQGKNLQIQQQGVGEIYFLVDAQTSSVFIFPLNTSVEIKLLDDSNQEITKIFLTPHMYVEIDTTKIDRVKNADALRIQTLFRLGYIAVSLKDIYDTHLLDSFGVVPSSFFAQVYEYISSSDVSSQKGIDLFKNQQVIGIFGNSVLQKYGSLFINPEKKEVYHKNEILRGYIDLLSSQQFDGKKIKILQEHVKKLSNLDTSSSTEMLELAEKIRFFLSSESNKDLLFAKISFNALIYPNFDEYTWYYSFYTQNLFRTYDVSGEFSPELSARFLQSFIFYSQNKPQDQRLLSQYFLLYLERQLTFLLTSSLDSDIIGVIDTLKNYIDISETLADKNLATARFTSMYIYDEILKNIDIFLREKYFKELRNQQNLLELSDTKITSKDLTSLQKQLQRIFSLYESFESNLGSQDTRSQQISKDIMYSQTQIMQYFLALENYQSYITQYTIAGDEIFVTEDDILQNDLSLQKAKTFLSRFQGVDSSQAEIEILDGYYNVKNLYISGKLFEFYLYPYDNIYKIKNIYIDGNEQRFMYNIQQDRDFPSQERELSDFFLDTFFIGNESTQTQEFIPEVESIQEDKDIIVLKRDILLGQNGHLKILEDILLIKYENISAFKKEEGYDITLTDVPVKNIAGAYLNSKFLLQDGKKYLQNTMLHIENIQTPLQIPAKIPIEDFFEILKEIEMLLPGTQNIFQLVSSKYQIEKTNLTYSHGTQKITFKFDSGGKKYTITQIGESIERFYIGTQNILQTPIKVAELNQYLP